MQEIKIKAPKVMVNGVLTIDLNPIPKTKRALEEWGNTLYIIIYDKRTLPQNNLLHKLLSEISNYTGESLDDLKAFFKYKFLGYVNHEVTDYMCDEEEPDCTKYAIKKTVQELRSTTTLTKKEFGDFITQIQAWAWENLSLNLSNIPEE